jgi:ABC-type branched-subunit amino acid transport system substrate-binding protein
MGTLALTAEERINVPPAAVFDLFGTTDAGWVFDAVCDRVEVGAVITLRAPLDGAATTPVDILGRISRLRRPSRIEVVHNQPWSGRLRLRFDPDGFGTRVRLSAEIDERGLEWLIRRRGHVLADGGAATGPRIGLLTSKSGPGSVFAAACDNAAAMAVKELNADGGLLGKPATLLVGDDATNPDTGVAEAWRLARGGCRTIFASTTSATFARVSEALRSTDVLLVHTVMNEGGLEDRLRIQLGERPEHQLAVAAKPVMRAAGGNRWFLAGNDYNWPRLANAAARTVLPRKGAKVVGEQFAPLGSQDFSPLIEAILSSGADVVLSTFVGADGAAFERQCYAMGVRDHCRTLALGTDEATIERIGPAAAPGMYGVSGYFQQLPSDKNKALVRRYRDYYGPWAPPLSTLSESVYEALHMYAAAVHGARTTDPHAVATHMRSGTFDFPRGHVVMDGPGKPEQRLYLAEAVDGELKPTLAL